MSQLVIFECDTRGCTVYLEVPTTSAAVAVRRARKQGWKGSEQHKKWFCPGHPQVPFPGPHESWCPVLRSAVASCYCRAGGGSTGSPVQALQNPGVTTVRVKGELL